MASKQHLDAATATDVATEDTGMMMMMKGKNGTRNNGNGISCISSDAPNAVGEAERPAPLQGKEYYRNMLLQQGEQLMQVLLGYECYFEAAAAEAAEAAMPMRETVYSAGPHTVQPSDMHEQEISPTPLPPSPSPSLLGERISAREDGVSLPTSAHLVAKSSSSSSSSSSPPAAAAVESPSSASSRVGLQDYYRELCLCCRKELQEAAASFDGYTKQMATLFKQPLKPIPGHLLNSFSGVDIIVAQDHQGRAATVKSAGAASRRPTSSLHKGEGDLHKTIEQHHPLDDDTQMECPPRFTIKSLSNGDLREHDALAGYAYWESEEPRLPKYILPSRLLDERATEAQWNYRFYSLRWRTLLHDVATAIGGEEGAELLRRYEAREASLPLPPKCRRAFYESVVNYDALLDDQERLFDLVENTLSAYHSGLLDVTQDDV